MIDDNKRREVARVLRGLSEGDSFAAEALDRDVYYDSLVLRVIRASVGRGDIFPLLADLIDPTCHLVETTSEACFYDPTVFHHELSCGHTCDTVWAEPPAYCSECGCRVVEEEE